MSKLLLHSLGHFFKRILMKVQFWKYSSTPAFFPWPMLGYAAYSRQGCHHYVIPSPVLMCRMSLPFLYIHCGCWSVRCWACVLLCETNKGMYIHLQLMEVWKQCRWYKKLRDCTAGRKYSMYDNCVKELKYDEAVVAGGFLCGQKWNLVKLP
jgi:hypothetical protein